MVKLILCSHKHTHYILVYITFPFYWEPLYDNLDDRTKKQGNLEYKVL